jgi:hypothetical protein
MAVYTTSTDFGGGAAAKGPDYDVVTVMSSDDGVTFALNNINLVNSWATTDSILSDNDYPKAVIVRNGLVLMVISQRYNFNQIGSPCCSCVGTYPYPKRP